MLPTKVDIPDFPKSVPLVLSLQKLVEFDVLPDEFRDFLDKLRWRGNRKLCPRFFNRNGFRQLFFYFSALLNHKLSLFTSHGDDLELFGGAFFTSAGFIATVVGWFGLGHLT